VKKRKSKVGTMAIEDMVGVRKRRKEG